MKRYYVAINNDAEHGRISESVDIVAHEAPNLQALESTLLDTHEGRRLVVGSFVDCWIKLPANANAEDYIAPLTLDQVTIQKPGQHPGGNRQWVTPRVDVYVVDYKDEPLN